MKEFKVTKHLKLRLEDKKTNIYVDGKLFTQCKYILLNIPVEKISSFDEIESVDDAYEQLDKTLEKNKELISPEIEFWAHCSNLQVWVENNYDSRLLHRNIAFPLLKKLTEAGDLKAGKMLKEEIARRLESRNLKIINYLIYEGYINYLDNTEVITSILKPEQAKTIFELNDAISDRIKLLTERIEFRETLDIKMELTIDMEKAENFTFLAENGKVVDILMHSIKDYFFEFYFEEIPKMVGDLIFLRKINLWGNHLRNLPEWFQDLTLLEEISLDDNRFQIFPEELTNLKLLKKIDLSSNNIKKIPNSISKLENLKELNLELNKLDKLPKSLGNLKHLEALYLNNNLLENLPCSIGNLEKLKELDLFGNKLTKLPKELGNLSELDQLTIAFNNLTKLPQKLLELKKLKVLTIDKTQKTLELLKKLKKEKVIINEL